MTLTILQNQGAVGQGAVGPVEQEKPVLLSSLFHQIISIERLGLHHGSGSHRVRAGGQLFAAKSEAEARRNGPALRQRRGCRHLPISLTHNHNLT